MSERGFHGLAPFFFLRSLELAGDVAVRGLLHENTAGSDQVENRQPAPARRQPAEGLGDGEALGRKEWVAAAAAMGEARRAADSSSATPAATAAGQKRLPGRANPTPRSAEYTLGFRPHTSMRIPVST